MLRLASTTLLLTTLAAAQTGVKNFNRGCGPVATWPRMTVPKGSPKIGTQLAIQGNLLAQSHAVITAIGLSNTAWGSVKLPLMIDPRPFPPCQLLVAPTLVFFGTTNRNGQFAFVARVPNDRRLIGAKVYVQMATPARLLSMTDGLELTIY